MAGATQLEPYNHDLGNAEIQNVKLQSLATDPTALEAKIYWNSASKVIRYHDGTVWQSVGTAGGTDTEAVQDIIGAAIVAGADISVTYNDTAGTVTIAVSGLTFADLTDGTEAVQDIVGAYVVGGAAVTSTYSDAGNTLTFDVAVDGSSIEVNADALRVKALGITDAMLAGSISNGKLTTNPLARANHTGTQLAATISDFTTAAQGVAVGGDLSGTVSNAQIATGAITNTDINVSAAIALSKLATDPLARANHTGTQAGSTVDIATTTARGSVELATDGENAANVVVQGNDSRLSNSRTPTAHASTHLSNGSDPIAAATTSVGGLLSAADKTKLDGVATGATANATDASLRDRATHTGTQTSSTISNFDTSVRTSRLDQMATPTASVAFGTQRITGLADGISATDAATFGQVQAAATGLKWKDPVRVVATGNLTLSAPQTIDGISVVAGDRVLAAGQTTAADRGVYIVAAGAWTRATDADAPAELNGATMLATAGTANAGDVYTQTATIVTVGTTGQTWVKVSEGNQTYTADGTTLTLTGSQFSIAAQGVGPASLGAVAGDGLTGGAGSALVVAVASIPRIVTGTLTGGSTSETITHNLGTRNVSSVTIANNASPYDTYELPYERTSVNAVTVYSVSNIPAGYTWTVVGRKA